MTQVAVTTRDLSERQAVAADLMGRCVDRKDILKAINSRRRADLSEWLTIPEFQAAVAQANREYIAELREMKSRIIAKSLALVEEEMAKANSKTRVEMAYGIVRSVI